MWYKIRLKAWLLDNLNSMIMVIAFLFATFLWNYFVQGGFEWILIEPIPTENYSLKLLSALVFLSFGKILYKLKFYKVLWLILVGLLRQKQLYRDVKELIWYGGMFIMGWVVAPWCAEILNNIISFFSNVVLFLAYLFPAFFIGLIACVLIWGGKYLYKKYV